MCAVLALVCCRLAVGAWLGMDWSVVVVFGECYSLGP